MVNEPSVLEPLKLFCIVFYLPYVSLCASICPSMVCNNSKNSGNTTQDVLPIFSPDCFINVQLIVPETVYELSLFSDFLLH